MNFSVYLFLIFFSLIPLSNAGYKEAIKYYNTKQYKQAIIEFKRVIKDENSDLLQKNNSMFNLAVIYDNGLGVPINKSEAISFYKMACDNNHKIAQYNLAWIYYHGETVEKNYFEAYKYYLLSAEQGYSKAQFNVAILLFSGEGTLKDYVMSYKWFKLASLNGITEAEVYLKKISRLIHSEELLQAEKLIKEWLKKI